MCLTNTKFQWWLYENDVYGTDKGNITRWNRWTLLFFEQLTEKNVSKDGLREGNGTRTLFNGKKFVCIWKDNRRWKGKSFDEEENEIGRFVNGEEEIYFKPPF